ncbi:TetR/AcrR family transcriptional regulator [Aureimonas jatrophae]|uniref:Transcriptional regulator, TetR family n=1 Tax=Aureimonas jatrophae TaxID=1166073 RepID=A0A1H0FD18_9HYPH|nr:TetR/AcrR family transcriptional regulator [Aureimonas jatrophae]MBB3950073.1 TetR/AcrR family transcriptional repressor for divergent bdcA [Aureimonas jatrophae]SDN92553.1 transcriptional regulator, TetR family [Aureimonas jatrophae]
MARKLFHERGFDAVGVADVTEALGIRPPSFYAAFGSKFGLYERVLERYAADGAVPFARLLRRDRPVAEGLEAVLEEAARRYAADRDATGCLVVEGMRCRDAQAREAACAYNIEAEAAIRAFVAVRHPEAADRITDFVATTMFGLSAKARNGHGLDQLLATARLAGAAVRQALAE